MTHSLNIVLYAVLVLLVASAAGMIGEQLRIIWTAITRVPAVPAPHPDPVEQRLRVTRAMLRDRQRRIRRRERAS
jgi:hypothetical protein